MIFYNVLLSLLTFFYISRDHFFLIYRVCSNKLVRFKVESNKEVEYVQASAAIERDNTNTNLRARHKQASSTGTYIKQARYALIHTYIHTYMYWFNSKKTYSCHPFSYRIYIHSAISAHTTYVYPSIQF